MNNQEFTDTELLDFLQEKNTQASYTGKCIFRMSTTGKGWRLHETSRVDAKQSVREAITEGILTARTNPYQYRYPSTRKSARLR